MVQGVWPGEAFARLEQDLGGSVQELLQKLNLLETQEDLKSLDKNAGPGKAFKNATPASVQVLTAGATSLSKVATWIVTSLGGLSAVGVAITTWTADEANNRPLMYVLVGASAVVMSAVAVAIAVIVKADVSARATASAAVYRARAETARALLGSFVASRPYADPKPRYLARKKGEEELRAVRGFVWQDEEIKVEVNGGRPLSGAQIATLLSFSDWQRERARLPRF